MSYSSDRLLLSSQRESQISRFRAWVLVVIPLFAILFQVQVPLFFPFAKVLDMPMLVVVYFAVMQRSQVRGLLIGAVVGLAQDSLSKNWLGMFGIVDTLVGYFAASIGMRLDVDHPMLRFILAFFFYNFHQTVYWVLRRALLAQMVPLDWQHMLVQAVFNAVVGVSLYHFLDRLRETA